MKLVKLLIGFLLLPVGLTASRVLWGLLEAAQPATHTLIPIPALALLTGFLLWTLMFTVFPRPVRSYIFAHELTHALWGLVMGASVSRFRVHRDHGSVALSKTNFLITLAPYFFPLYTVLVIGIYYLLWLFFAVEKYELLWLALVGASWGFHLTFTVSALLQHQSDIRLQGHLFSYSVIYLANVLGICAWIILVSGAGTGDAMRLANTHSRETWRILCKGWNSLNEKMAPLLSPPPWQPPSR